jgi:hypothetical protein
MVQSSLSNQVAVQNNGVEGGIRGDATFTSYEQGYLVHGGGARHNAHNQ